MHRPLALLVAVALLSAETACKRKSVAAPEAPLPALTPEAPAPAAPTAASTPSAPTSAPPAATSLPQAKPGASESSPLNAELTNAVARFRDKHKRLPANWQELVQSGFLKAVPTPPPGVRYLIDPVSAMVVEVK